MIRRVFIDANVVIDLLNEKNRANAETVDLFNRLFVQENVLLCTPVTFAIVYYFLGKQLKNKRLLNEKMKRLFLPFAFTKEDAEIMSSVFQSSFTDLEDALQYYAAMEAGAEVIITKNYFDFYFSSIPVYHPTEYIQMFL